MEKIRSGTAAVRVDDIAGSTFFSDETLVLMRYSRCGGSWRWDSRESRSPTYHVSNWTLNQSHSGEQDSYILNFLGLLRIIPHISRGKSTPLISLVLRQRGMYTATDVLTLSMGALLLSATQGSEGSAFQSAASTTSTLLTITRSSLGKSHNYASYIHK